MPFTFSHPAIVLPFLSLPYRWRSTTGLIVGSMAPDFEKFIRMSLHDPYSHTWPSIFYFNLPIGILACFVFHLIIRDTLIDHLPGFLRQRLNRFKRFEWKSYFKKNWPIVVLSLLVGIVSHLGWDAFTHRTGLGVRLFPILEERILPEPYRRPLFAFLQQVLSVIGGIIMMVFVFRLPPEQRPLEKKPLVGFWSTSAVIVCVVVTLWLLAGGRLNRYYIMIAALSAGLLSLIILPFLIRIKDQLFSKT
ncbi:DUF4184 family protein [Rufibacter glacialis]|uniref:DUF4184 family protein n=1 Tax=Rufibacter glacialis TaxID=1259555 RepID=A0A5M8QN82_9BACT|nr:DUF4184 family protein [Rufibacter glacialis]KAA6437595.1 DUF4184 family protein [Rufibacter glacialis]GGK58028.1 hypothetical protein GCM10011405_02580 [Rufibacter glacialis]